MFSVKEHYRLPWDMWQVCLLAAVVIAVWVAAHRLRRHAPTRRLQAGLFVALTGIGFFAFQALFQVLLRWVQLETQVALWLLALVGSAGVETLVYLYTLERRTVSRRTGAALVGLRATLMLLLIAMIAQPVYSTTHSETIQKAVVILLDESRSMHRSDPQMPDAEKIRLAEMVSLPGVQRENRLDRVSHYLEQSAGQLDRRLARLEELAAFDDPNEAERWLPAVREDIRRAAESVREGLGERMEALRKPGEDSVRTELSAARARLEAGIKSVERVLALTHEEAEAELPSRQDELVEQLGRASAELTAAAEQAMSAADTLDAHAYAKLSEEVRTRVDALADQPRLDLARHALLNETRSGEKDEAFDVIERFRAKGYEVRAFSFASDVRPMDLGDWAKGYRGADTPLPPPDADDPRLQQSRGAWALDSLASGALQGARVARVLLVSDGRFTDADSGLAEQAARRLADRGAVVDTLAVGCAHPPRDAAIVHIDAPTGPVYKRGKAQFRLQVQLSRMGGARARVVLRKTDPAGEAAGEPLVEEVRVPDETDLHTTTVELTDEDTAEPGLYTYTAEIGRPKEGSSAEVVPFADEAEEGNNSGSVAVNISDDRSKVLIVEGRPRWEYRYLKNLFAHRDESVKLQHVLLQPDRIAGRDRRRHVAASAARPYGEAEATDLPGHAPEFREDEDAFRTEWHKFDVIVLGDVGMQMLAERDRDALVRFVKERGGTLVVVAGPHHMPHEFGDTELADMLPLKAVTATDEAAARTRDKESRRPYRIALTDTGRRHAMMRLIDDPDRNARHWTRQVPRIYWHCPVEGVRAGAQVLAYALPESPPDYVTAPRENMDEDTLRRREQFEKDHALVAVQKYARGKVLMLAFDRTWRLRYRVGDRYHHRFWGQVMRWATSDKLPVGTRTVRLGAEPPRVRPGEPVKIKCMVLDEDMNPLEDDRRVVMTVSKRVERDGPDAGYEPVEEVLMRRTPTGLGQYEAELADLSAEHGGGTYRVEFSPSASAPEARRIIAAQAREVDDLALEFEVGETYSQEDLHLSAAPGVLRDYARQGGGRLVRPQQLPDIAAGIEPGIEVRAEEGEPLPLWRWWPVLAVILAAATAEWVIRKRSGLA